MALIDDLNAELTQIVARRAQVVASPKPNYTIDGKDVSWADYYKMLVDQQLAIEQAIQRAGSPFQLSTRWKT